MDKWIILVVAIGFGFARFLVLSEAPKSWVKCPDCNGSGRVDWPKHVRGGTVAVCMVEVRCPKCKGTGKIELSKGGQ